MRFLMRVKFPNDTANDVLRDPQFGAKMHDLLNEIHAEATYFTTIDGYRGCFSVIDLKDASEMPRVAEPFFIWMQAEIDWYPVMSPEDLGKAGPDIAAAYKKWG